MHNWFPEAIARQMQREISAAENNEVFFCGEFKQGSIVQVKVMARGNQTSVPAVVHPEQGKCLVVIHNHPSGDLTPSGADITAASRLAREGVGFAIVNNSVSQCYILVEPVESSAAVCVAAQQIEDILAPGGLISRALDEYESRPQQMEMALNLADALNNGEHALAEAGTGTGKSLAYLVPVAMWAKANGRRAVVSTNTINLQEQLLYKDIPLLQRTMPFAFKAVLVKGRANYLCRRKFRELLQQGEDMIDEKDLPILQALVTWEKQTKDGSRSDLGINPGSDLWELICSDADMCLRINCPFFRECFFHSARREALDAQLLIVNHSLLFADIAMRSRGADTGVLPEYHCIVFDEAHNIERVATDWLGARVTRLSFSRLLARLWSARHNKVRGVLAVLEQKLLASTDLDHTLTHGLVDTIRHNLSPELLRLGEEISGFFAGVEHFLGQQGTPELKVRLTEDFVSSPGWRNLTDKARQVFRGLDELARLLDSLHNRLENLGPLGFESFLSPALELASIRTRLSGLTNEMREVILGDDSTLVRWLELGNTRTGPRAVFNYAPLSVSRTLRDNVWEKFASVLFTSATLTVDKNFDYMRDRLGLDPDLKVREMQYDSPFDYQRRVLLGIAEDLPAPEERSFAGEIAPAVLASIVRSRGRALVLFTSFSLLKATTAAIRPELEAQGISLLCQGEQNRHMLLEKFRSDTRSVLMATASFWEGVDVAGESLSNVILTRLPFTVPDEPVIQARMEDLRRQGKNPFYCFQVPQAVLRFKQGFGRLIRTKQDKGVVLVLDKRIKTKSYGRWFLDTLPACPTRSGPVAEILAWQGQFLD